MKASFLKKTLLSLCFLPLGVHGRQLDNDQLIDLMQSQRYKDAAAYIRTVFPGTITDLKMIRRLAYCDYM